VSAAPQLPAAAVVDSTALLALGAGNQTMSRLVAVASGSARLHVYAPAMCVTAAVAARPALADHIGGLLAIQVVDLGFAAATAAGALIAAGADWRHAHAVAAAAPSAEWPSGLPVVTVAPDVYTAHGIQAVGLVAP
jgi:hypothetical protein